VSTPAEIVLDRRGGSIVARLNGEVDMSNASYVRDQLLASMPNDALALVLDITDCRYLDSAAIEVLFEVSRRLGRRRQELRLVMPPESPLRRVIELTEVHTAAPVYESLERAVTE
jgi:anti-sigma B factor antagonist